MSDHDLEWWKARAIRRYREVQQLRARVSELEADLARVMPTVPHPTTPTKAKEAQQ